MKKNKTITCTLGKIPIELSSEQVKKVRNLQRIIKEQREKEFKNKNAT